MKPLAYYIEKHTTAAPNGTKNITIRLNVPADAVETAAEYARREAEKGKEVPLNMTALVILSVLAADGRTERKKARKKA